MVTALGVDWPIAQIVDRYVFATLLVALRVDQFLDEVQGIEVFFVEQIPLPVINLNQTPLTCVIIICSVRKKAPKLSLKYISSL